MLKNIWKEFKNEFMDAWIGSSLIGFYGNWYINLAIKHKILAFILRKVTAISYIFYWLVFGLVFLGGMFLPLLLFWYYKADIDYWWVYESIWVIIAGVFFVFEILPWLIEKK